MRFSKVVFFIFLLNACISPYNMDSGSSQRAIVVEGMITDQPGQNLVKISMTQAVSDQLTAAPAVSGATVVIADDLGNEETLTELSSGNYYTSSTQGVIGRSYSLKIQTKEGEVYQSSMEKLLPVGDFSLSSEFYEGAVNGFNIYANVAVLPEQENRVWWRYTGTFEFITFPQFNKALTDGVWVPAPFPCSGYKIPDDPKGQQGGPPVKFAECTCCTCWVNQYNQMPLISNVDSIRNGAIDRQKIGFIEATPRTFFDKYYLEVEQLSVSQTIYDFWKKVKDQKVNGSDLFQTPPPKTTSNISLVKGSLPVIGYFAASSSKKHVMVLSKSDLPYLLDPIDSLFNPCQRTYMNSTTQKPSFW
jgi:hypothetical protein